MALMWAIWRERNDRVWRHRSSTAERVVEGAKEALEDWSNAQVQRQQPSGAGGDRCLKWHPPEEGTLKINVDAAVFMPQHHRGIGLCLRDHRGDVFGYKMIHQRGIAPAREVEAMALLEALRWAEDSWLQRVVFECDAKEIVECTLDEEDDDTEFGDAIRQCIGSIRHLGGTCH
ncbi:hypothetical protein LINPERHAP1_LOCUS28680 [Linum perenne]